MGRKKNPKGKIFSKKDEKIIATLQTLPQDCNDETIVKKFKELYPVEWTKIVKRYNAHERLTPEGKSHPMPHPRKYLLNIFRKYRLQYANGADLNEALDIINTPKPKFLEETPTNITNIITELNNNSYEKRIDAINKLGKFKCDQSITELCKILESDKIFEVRKTAFDRLIRFGYNAEHPKKDELYIDNKIQEKFLIIRERLKDNSSIDEYIKKFKLMYPIDYDIHSYQKKNRFKHWVKNIVSNLPK